MEKFLNFWSHNNVAIIETLIGTVLLISIYVAWKSLFSKDSGHSAGSGESVHVDTSAIEAKLQKILENQANAPAAPAAPAIDLSKLIPAEGSGISPEALEQISVAHAEIQRLSNEMDAKAKQVTQLEQQVQDAEKRAQEAAANAGAAAPAPSGGGDTSALEAKIKDLESRLEEYEIISEDIADISKFKEENVELKAEIEKLKEQLANAGAPSGNVVALDPALDIPSDVAALMEQPTQIDEPIEATSANEAASDAPVAETATPSEAAPVAEAAAEPVAPSEPPGIDVDAALAEAAANIPESSAISTDILSDDLMAEFEAAVAQQQSGTLANADAAPVSDAAPAGDMKETEQLIGDFENFVKKS